MLKTPLARRLRRDQTPAERKFWELLHPYRKSGWHIRRQSPIGDYIVDFVCKRAGLVFEVDGKGHPPNDIPVLAGLSRGALHQSGCAGKPGGGLCRAHGPARRSEYPHLTSP